MNRIAFLLILGVFVSAHSHAALIPDPERVQTVEIQTAVDSISESGGGVLSILSVRSMMMRDTLAFARRERRNRT